jgi:hypothetical protein
MNHPNAFDKKLCEVISNMWNNSPAKKIHNKQLQNITTEYEHFKQYKNRLA